MAIARVGTEIYNLLRLGFLKAESAGSDRAIKAATTKYNKTIESNPEFARVESIRLNGDTDRSVQDLGERTIITPESLMGNVLVPVAGDRTLTGNTLTKSQGFGLLDNVNIKGGPRFPMEHRNKNLGWASMEDAAKKKQNNFGLAARETDNPDIVGVYTAMGDEANNFATPIAEVIINQLSGNKIPKEVISEFDSNLRKARPNWVGINHPEAKAQLMGMDGYPQKGAGKLRSSFTKLASMAKYRNEGFPSRERIRDDVVEPELLNADRGASGFTMFDAVPDGKTIPFTENPSYDTGILGQFRGGLTESVPAEIMFPDVFSELSKKLNKNNVPLSRHEILGSLVMDPKLYQKADQKWLDNIASYLEKNQSQLGASLPATAVGLLSAGAMVASDDSEAGVVGVVKRLIEAGYPESTAMKIATGELPMDYASRMARAKEQGFTEKAYHTGKNADNPQGILSLNPPSSKNTGTFLSGIPELTASYTGPINSRPTSYPMLVNTRGMEKTDADGANWNDIFSPVIEGPDGKQVMEVFEDDMYPSALRTDSTVEGVSGSFKEPLYQDDYVTTNELARGSKERGATGAVIDNVIDVGPNQRAFNRAIKSSNPHEYPHEWIQDYERKGGKIISVQDGSQARSELGAAFDPDNINSTNILGSNPAAFLGAGILGLGGMASSDDSHASNVPLDQLYSPSSLNKAKGILGDVGSIQAPISGNVSKLGSMMGDFNRNISDDALLGMIAPELPAELVNKMAYGDKRGLLDYIRAGLGLI